MRQKEHQRGDERESQEWWVCQKDHPRGTEAESSEWWVVDLVEYQREGVEEFWEIMEGLEEIWGILECLDVKN